MSKVYCFLMGLMTGAVLCAIVIIITWLLVRGAP